MKYNRQFIQTIQAGAVNGATKEMRVKALLWAPIPKVNYAFVNIRPYFEEKCRS